MISIVKKLAGLTIILGASMMYAQEEPKNTSDFKLGEGLTFSFNEGDYAFNIGGFIQPNINYEKIKGLDDDYEFNVKSAFFMLSGKAVKEKVSFLLQTDFSKSSPLMDAWVAYHPTQWMTITGGQKQTFVNNREMLYREDKLQFANRGMLSRMFSDTGREFGLFVETKFGKTFGIVPRVALTSGDGRNSFGTDSRDSDYGGLKIGGRLDLYPLGYFTEGNDQYTADLAHEESIKILLGAAASKNKGASNRNGEGHGDFMLYDSRGMDNLPDYSQAFIDLLIKYKGFSLLTEYANASAKNLGIPFTDEAASTLLAPKQISEYLVLGDSYNVQLGYVTTSGFSFDFRYENSQPEFKNYAESILQESSGYTFGLAKYFDGNNLKMQASVSTIDYKLGSNVVTADVLLQIVF